MIIRFINIAFIEYLFTVCPATLIGPCPEGVNDVGKDMRWVQCGLTSNVIII